LKAVFEVIGGPMDGTIFSLEESGKIGRAEECKIHLPYDKFISRDHADIIFRDDGIFLKDNNSRNGTFVNGMLIEQTFKLDSGIEFTAGSTCLKINITES